MGFSTTERLGEALGRTNKSQEDTKQQITPNDPTGQYTYSLPKRVIVQTNLTVSKREMGNIWRLGHPVWGEMGPYPMGVPVIMDHPVWGFLDRSYIYDDLQYDFEVLFSN